MTPDYITAIGTIANAVILLAVAIITKRYSDATREILDANRKSLDALRTSTYGNTFIWAANLLSSPEIVRHRATLFKSLPQYHGTVRDMSKDLHEAFEEVCRTYDLVGIACHNGMLTHEIIAKEWGNSLIRLHELCARHLSELRADRGQFFWNNFTELYKESKKVWD